MPAVLKLLVSPLLDPIGSYALAPPMCGRWGVHLHGDRRVKRVALTFDDGPVRGGTERVLDVLREFGVPATFFCVGVNVALNPRIVCRIVKEGHVVGNHSMHHSRLDSLSLTDRSHFLESEKALQAVLRYAPRLYRAPWGWNAPWEVRRLRQQGFEPIGWDVDTLDSQNSTLDAGRLGRRAARATRPGSIILLHDGEPHAATREKPATVQTLGTLIPRLLGDGYEFVTVCTLLGLSACKDVDPPASAHALPKADADSPGRQ